MSSIPPLTATTSAPDPGSARLKQAARQFEAMFMTEMLRQARPANKAAGPFAGGRSEGAWQVFMDQALGQAATANGVAGDKGLAAVIEKSLREAQRHGAPSGATVPPYQGKVP